MTPLFAALLIFGFLLVLVSLAVGLQAFERAFPEVSEWLDRFGSPGPWE